MTPADPAALRGLLETLADMLTVPATVSPADDTARLRLVDARAECARHGLRMLLGGPLDWTAIQAESRVLRAVTDASPALYRIGGA